MNDECVWNQFRVRHLDSLFSSCRLAQLCLASFECVICYSLLLLQAGAVFRKLSLEPLIELYSVQIPLVFVLERVSYVCSGSFLFHVCHLATCLQRPRLFFDGYCCVLKPVQVTNDWSHLDRFLGLCVTCWDFQFYSYLSAVICRVARNIMHP